jgi:predicted dehydrogenase
MKTRRSFLGTAASALAVPLIIPGLRAAGSANGRLQVASFGASGQAAADIEALCASDKFQLIAVADVDTRNIDALKTKYKERFPDLRGYQDWRELLAQEKDRLDACHVATPDHMHGPIGLSALAAGKHLYCQKPLTQNLWECRQMMLRAKEKGVMTQMGIQVSSDFTERFAVELVRLGAIGKVQAVHTFSNKKWGDMQPLPTAAEPPPAELAWDKWLGVAAERPYLKGVYHPGNWRKRRDFGTGTLGDMGCHIFSSWFRALDLTTPLKVKSTGTAPATADSWAVNGRVEYTYPGTAYTEGKTVAVTWYDGDNRPPQNILDLIEKDPSAPTQVPGQGNIIIGTEGVLLHPHGSTPRLFPVEKFKGYKFPKLEPRNHYVEWVEKSLSGKELPSAHFGYASPLTEAVLLGCLSSLFPQQELVWDSPNLTIPNHAEASKLIHRAYRKGWEIA